MIAPSYIRAVFKKFDNFPMETLTKVWMFSKSSKIGQRSVEQMKEHREQYGITGNCFDLALWLLDEFNNAKIEAYPIAHHLHTEKAHVAIVALDEEGKRYLCDLGDQWLQPILIEESFKLPVKGFFPATDISVQSNEQEVMVYYHRPNGKVSKQSYDTKRIDIEEFLVAANFSQQQINQMPLLEVRVPYKLEVAHWEFNDWHSFLSTTEGIFKDIPANSVEEWAQRIHDKTDYNMEFLIETLTIYKEMMK